MLHHEGQEGVKATAKALSLDSLRSLGMTNLNRRNSQRGMAGADYSTVTDLAKLRGWSTSQPRRTAM